MRDRPLPLVAILDGSVAMTGAVQAAIRAATLLSADARFVLLLPSGTSVRQEQLPPNLVLQTVALPSLRRSVSSIFRYPLGAVRAASRLKRLLHRSDARVLQVNDFHLLPGLLVRPLGWRGRIVTVVRIDVRRFGLIGRLWLDAARRWSDRILAVSQFVQRTAGLPVESLLYDPLPTTQAISSTRPRPPLLLFIGNYIAGKGQDAAIRAFHRIADAFPTAELHFHGGDMGLAKNRHYRHSLQDLAANGAGAGRIQFYPFSPGTGALLATARAALILSHNESFSFTCQEASACGVPVIATRCGGPEEIIVDELTGFLVDVDDDAAIAERMARLLSDPDLASTMGERGAALMQQRFAPAPWRDAMRRHLDLDPVLQPHHG